MKALYYRETNPETGKQKWIRLSGVKSDGDRLMIHPNFWNESTDPFQVLYTKSVANLKR